MFKNGFKMVRSGFTLAEVLITLGIIGVVAAMTMPTLMNATNGAQYKTAFKKALSVISQAVVLNLALDEYDFGRSVDGTGDGSIYKLLDERMNVVDRKDAAIAKAEADRDVAIAQAEADQKANEARIAAETEIAKQNNDLEIRKAELKMQADTKKAEADAAYKIQEQEQRKIIGVKETDAAIAKQEREIILKEKEADAQEKALDAEVRKKADADLYDREKKAEAERIEKQKKAEAERYQIEQEALAQQKKAEAIRQLGAAEAEAIRLKATAEAEGMEKKAEAYRKYNNMAMAEQLIKILPDIAGKIAEPMAQIDKITIIGGGSGNGIAGVTDTVPAVMAKLIESMKETTGVDLADILKAESYDAKVTKNVNFTGIPEGNADVAPVVAGAIADAVVDKLSENETEDDDNTDMKAKTRKNK